MLHFKAVGFVKAVNENSNLRSLVNGYLRELNYMAFTPRSNKSGTAQAKSSGWASLFLRAFIRLN